LLILRPITKKDPSVPIAKIIMMVQRPMRCDLGVAVIQNLSNLLLSIIKY
jgi:hypothetical protein